MGGLIEGIGSLFGGAFAAAGQKYSADKAYQSNKETNEQNYKIWQEQQNHNIKMFNLENRANVDMWNMQNQANIDMWNMQNEYNDPSAQIARMRNAGLNPSLMMGNNPGGVASSAPSAGQLSSAHAQPAQAPTMQSPSDVAFQSPLTAFAQGALNSLVSIAQAFKLNEDGNLAKEQGEDLKNTRPFRIADLRESYGLKKAQAYQAFQSGDYSRGQAELERLTQGFKVEYSKELTEYLRAQKIGQMLGNFQQSELNKWLPAEKQIMFLSSVGNLFQQGAQLRLTEAQIKTEIERRLDIAVGREMKEEELKVYRKVKGDLINSLSSGYQLEYILNKGSFDWLSGGRPVFSKVPYKPNSNPNFDAAINHRFGVRKKSGSNHHFNVLGLYQADFYNDVEY